MGSGKVDTWLAKVDTFRPRVDTFGPGVDTFGGRLNTCPPLRPMRPRSERERVEVGAEALRDLAGLPSHRLEALSGDRIGRYSIQINRQWRICFRWSDDGPIDVEIVDYHR